MSNRDRVAAYFREHPNRWISAITLVEIGGTLSSRTRISECRTELGMRVDNRVRRVVLPNGDVFVASEFRYVTEPQEAPDLPAEMYTQQPGLW